MSTKGKHPRSDDKNPDPSLTGRDKKRAKNFAQRTIETQPSPSTSTSLSTGPRAIDVVYFAESRSFEINAMESALERAAKGGNRRIFQTLPRHLRRRAASHNVKRLPKKLRAYAEKEMELDGTAKPKANRRKKRRPGTIAEEYLRRQATKNWLETHVWHAKRMHMQEKWGYKIPECSQEKSVRASYRASQTACLAHDASYFGVTEVSGMENDLVKLLDRHLDPTAPSIGSARYRTGKRVSSNYMYRHLGYPLSGISPVTLLWRPESGDTSQPQRRTLWIWTHPSAHRTVVESLETAVKDTDLTVIDMQSELLTFELTGPKSHHILQSILTLSKSLNSNLNSTAHSTWENLRCLRSSSSLPPGAVLGLCIQDPRLDFPQKVEWNPAGPTPEEEAAMQKQIVSWPETAAASSIWDAEVRSSTISSRPAEQVLNDRRREMLIPGTKLSPNESDVHVPILLIQRNGATDCIDKSTEQSEVLNGWNIVVPRGWGMAIWKSLVFSGARTAGQVERRQVHFEAGLPCFPYDFPGTAAYEEHMRVEVEKSTAIYEKKPPAKRPNYSKLKVESPFAAPFMSLVNMAMKVAEVEKLPDCEVAMSTDDEDETETVPESERLGATTIAKVDPESTPLPPKDDGVWLLSGSELLSSLRDTPIADDIESDVRFVTQSMNARILEASAKKKIGLPDSILTCERFCRAVVRVRITLLGRGVPGPNGIVYLPDSNEFSLWKQRLQKKKGKETEHEQNEMDQIPPKDRIIGYLTSGQFSFTQTCGYALGCCSAVGIRRLMATETSEKRSIKNFVLVRGITGRVPRPARIEIIA